MQLPLLNTEVTIARKSCFKIHWTPLMNKHIAKETTFRQDNQEIKHI
jgi:hypothetical protein